MMICEECEDDIPGATQDMIAGAVLDWADRYRLLHGRSKESWDLFQECAEDLRA